MHFKRKVIGEMIDGRMNYPLVQFITALCVFSELMEQPAARHYFTEESFPQLRSLPLARSYEFLYPSTLRYTASLGCLQFPTPQPDFKIIKTYVGN
jgi:hypothetical protein